MNFLHKTTWRRAFTLIEILMAAAAATIILAAVYGVFGRAIRLRDAATDRSREARLRARAVAVIANDLRNATISGGTLAATLEGARQSPGSRFPGYLKFTATTAQDEGEDAFAGDVQEIEYFVADDESAGRAGTGVLIRTVDRHLLAPVREVPREQRLLSNVGGMEVDFYDGTSWTDVWTYSKEEATLPEAIRVRVTIGASGEKALQPPLEILVPWTTTPLAAESTATDVSPPPAAPGPNPPGESPGETPSPAPGEAPGEIPEPEGDRP